VNKDFLFKMLKTPSPGGCEIVLQKSIVEYMNDSVDEVRVDTAGNVYSLINTSSPYKVLLDGHIDEICLRVIDFTSDGYLKVARTGGVRACMYLGQKVRIFNGKDVIYGAVVADKDLYKKETDATDLTIDIGATSKDDAKKYVKHGDWVIFDTDVRELVNDCITARAMDDRIGVFIILEAIKKAKELGATVGVCACSVTGEETNGKGAYYAASHFKPNISIVVDVTFASDFPSSEKGDTGEVNVGGGAVIDHGVSLNRIINNKLEAVAKKYNIPIQFELSSGNTYTDEGRIQYSNIGVPTALVSIPLRNMHSPAEVGSLKDIKACIDLIAHFLCEIDEKFDANPFLEEF